MPEVMVRELEEQRRHALAVLVDASADGDDLLADAMLYRLDELEEIAQRAGVREAPWA